VGLLWIFSIFQTSGEATACFSCTTKACGRRDALAERDPSEGMEPVFVKY